MSCRPLVVDLDGTLVQTDLVHESAIEMLRKRPLHLLQLIFKPAGRNSALRQYMAGHVALTPATLPYNSDLLHWLREERAKGRELILLSAADKELAQAVAEYLDLFDDVISGDDSDPPGPEQQARALCERFGPGGFDYAGNGWADLPIWKAAAEAVVVNADDSLASAAGAIATVAKTFPAPQRGPAEWARAVRVQQWLKNLLLFAPLLAAHRIMEAQALLTLVVAFLGFSLSASAMYIVNDLLDLESDRLHPRKRKRPLAAGIIPVAAGLKGAALLLAAGLVLAWQTTPQFFLCLLCYLLLTCCYSLFLKRYILLDCITLAVLYTLRIVAGAAAVNMGLSFWLLAFSVFLFLSLAFVKRYAELGVQSSGGSDRAHGRGYVTADASLLQNLGISAGYASALVLSLYLNSEQVLLLYATPAFVWGAVLILLFWISWMWMQAHRGHMHDDPLVFAIQDKTSWCAGVLFLAVLFLGSVNWS